MRECVRVCVCVCVCMYVCAHVYVCMRVCAHMYMHMLTLTTLVLSPVCTPSTPTPAHTRTRPHAHTHTRTHAHMHTRTHRGLAFWHVPRFGLLYQCCRWRGCVGSKRIGSNANSPTAAFKCFEHASKRGSNASG